jgi:hypothetical protein
MFLKRRLFFPFKWMGGLMVRTERRAVRSLSVRGILMNGSAGSGRPKRRWPRCNETSRLVAVCTKTVTGPLKTTANTFATNYVRPQGPCPQMTRIIRFLVTANSPEGTSVSQYLQQKVWLLGFRCSLANSKIGLLLRVTPSLLSSWFYAPQVCLSRRVQAHRGSGRPP